MVFLSQELFFVTVIILLLLDVIERTAYNARREREGNKHSVKLNVLPGLPKSHSELDRQILSYLWNENSDDLH